MKQKTKRAGNKKARNGSALLLTTILLFVVLSMVVSLSYVTVMEQKMSQKSKGSVGSFFNADSGVEWALNKIANSSGILSAALAPDSDGSVSCPFSGCKVYFLKSDGTVITQAEFASLTFNDIKAVRSVGTQGGETQRAIEAAVAAGGGGCYVQYLQDLDIGAGKKCPSNTDNGCCLTGFTNKGYLGRWGRCAINTALGVVSDMHYPPTGRGLSSWSVCGQYSSEIGSSFVCCL